MHNRVSKVCFTVLSVIFLCTTMADAADKTLSLVSSSGLDTIEVTAGDSITVEVKIDDASVVAGASFTVNYDTANLSLTSVGSTFFDTFTNQNIPTPNDQGYVTVDSVDYYSPVIDTTVSGLISPITTGSMLAAARFDNGSGTNVTLFTLNFELIGTSGTYPMTISQSKINNEAAGYSAIGDLIPYLVGIDGTSYPTYGPDVQDDYALTPIGCTVNVNPSFVDSDGDGIDDNWERANIPADTPEEEELNIFTANGDYDSDGYSDLQEYLNYINNVFDPQDAAYDPKVENAPDGTGYVPLFIDIGFLPAIYKLLL